jgi:hypothetical protein
MASGKCLRMDGGELGDECAERGRVDMFSAGRRFQNFFRHAAGRAYSQSVGLARESQMKYYLSPLFGLVLGGVFMVVCCPSRSLTLSREQHSPKWKQNQQVTSWMMLKSS